MTNYNQLLAILAVSASIAIGWLYLVYGVPQ